MTPSGIEPATCWFVAQCLNHYATTCPCVVCYVSKICDAMCNRPCSNLPFWTYCCIHAHQFGMLCPLCIHTSKADLFLSTTRCFKQHNIWSKAEDFCVSLQFVYSSYPFHNYCYSTIWINNQDTKISYLVPVRGGFFLKHSFFFMNLYCYLITAV